MKFCFLASRSWFYEYFFFFCVSSSPFSFACFLLIFRRVKNASGIFILVFKVFFSFFALPLAFIGVSVCVCSIHTHSDTHVFHTTNLHTHIRTIFSVIVRISIVLSSSLSSCYASFARPIVVAALFVCCSCNCCWRRKHEKPCKAVKRPWQMASQYIHELI